MHVIIVNDEHEDEPRVLAVNTSKGIQIQIEQDGNDAFIDLTEEEAINLVATLNDAINNN